MRVLSAAELLDVWERGQEQTPVQRALLLLGAVCPDTPAEALARLSFGRRDAQLLALRERLFGAELACLAVCLRCGERLELAFSTADITADIAAGPPSEPAETLALEAAGYKVRFRLPDSRDLLDEAIDEPVDEAPEDDGLAARRRRLLARCLLSARRRGAEVAPDRLPPAVIEAVAARMAEADPQADVQLALACPCCGHRWQAPFDILAFLWEEIGDWAQRLLREVHTLAAAYHWREADILALSPWRRQFYLEMIV